MKIDFKKLRQNPKFIFAVIVLIFTAAGTGYYFWKQSQYVLYENAGYGFSIKYPKGWDVLEGNEGSIVGFLSPQEDDLDLFRENVNIAVEQLGPRKVVLLEYAAVAIRQLRGVFKDDVKILVSEKAFFAGRAAHKLVYNLVSTYRLRIMHIWVFKKGSVYTVTYTADEGSFEEYLKIVQPVINSFKLNK